MEKPVLIMTAMLCDFLDSSCAAKAKLANSRGEFVLESLFA
jgi:hypothetical protein